MMTNTGTGTPLTMRSTSQQVVVVSKQSQLPNGLLETVLDAGQHDVVFVESTERAHSHIKGLSLPSHHVPRYRRARRLSGVVDAEARSGNETSRSTCTVTTETGDA